MIISSSSMSFNFIDKNDSYVGFSSKSYSDYGDEIGYKILIKELDSDDDYKILFCSDIYEDDLYNSNFNDIDELVDYYNDSCLCLYNACEHCESDECNDECCGKCDDYKDLIKEYKNTLFAKDFEDFLITKINYMYCFEISDGKKTYEILIKTNDYCSWYNDYTLTQRFEGEDIK